MKKIIVFLSFLLPLFVRRLLFQVFAQSLGKGFDFGSMNKEFNLLKKFIDKDPKILIDVGANKGDYSDEMIKNYPNAKIYIFEPQKYLYDKLNEKYKKNNNIKIYNIALDKTENEALLIKGFDGDGEASIYLRKYLKNDKNFQEKILCKRLDQIITNQKIDFIKVDVEGNEMNVLKGMDKIINNVKILQVEFGGTWIDSRFFYRDLYEYMNTKNFDLFRMAPNGLIRLSEYEEIDEYFTFTNFVCVNRNSI